MAKKNLAVVVTVSLIVLFLGSACNSAGSGSDETVSYAVSFTLNGTDYVLTKGFTAKNVFDPGANGSRSEGGSFTRMGAAAEGVTDVDTDGPHVWISVHGSGPGTYTSTDAEIDVFFATDEYYYTSDGAPTPPPDPDPRTVTITKMSDGRIEGTFSGTLTGGTGTATVTNGRFVVEHLADGVVVVPPWWT